MNNYIDIYCERLFPGLWAEPMNAATNLAFFLAALLAFRLAASKNALTKKTITLIGLITIIGIGSTLFHTFATGWAQLSDSIPILFYQIAFLAFYARGVIKLGWLGTTGLLFAYMGATVATYALPHDMLNGSIGYAPALVFIFGLGLYHLLAGKKEKWILFVASLVFTASLTFRTLDNEFCHIFPIGTHYVWHVLNGMVLYLTTRSYIVNTAK